MNVLLTADPYIPVPPTLYGGIERVVEMLARGLVERGHDVSLIAHPQSDVPVRLYGYGVPPHTGWKARMGELGQVGRLLWRLRAEIDVVHSFGRLAALLPVLPDRALAKIQSYQRDHIPWRSVRIANHLAGNSIAFTGCSRSVYKDMPQGPSAGEWHSIFNCVEMDKYPLRAAVAEDAPLAFLGRIERIKGVHNAIAIARLANRRLIIAGNRVPSGSDGEYFEREVASHIDGERISYVGPVDDRQKSELLGASCALLMPIEWDEPFGIVMAEAMACGTPVLGFARGSVCEVVRDGVNGFQAAGVADAASKVSRLGEIDRGAVRRDCEERFSSQVIVSAYEALYARVRERSMRGSR